MYASLELCKELYELSGWEPDVDIQPFHPEWQSFLDIGVPAYDLGFLLRKLPAGWYLHSLGDEWVITDQKSHYHTADTPENAAAKLAIELFKQGVLKHG